MKLEIERVAVESMLIMSLVVAASASPFVGELSLLASATGTEGQNIQLQSRYLPTFQKQGILSEVWDYNLELRWQLQWNSRLDMLDFSDANTLIEPYRVAVNLQSSRSEIILGLQKINFGSAKILRPLMWFDSLNPTDPLEITSGVTGLTARHYFDSGWSSQLWLLIPGDPIGWEAFADQSNTLEAGGRISLPVFRGQIGVAADYRVADGSRIDAASPDIAELKLGVDGFWDAGIGLWLESAYTNQQQASATLMEQLMTTVGADYTFWVGNGIFLTLENLNINTWNSPLSTDQNMNLSSLLVSYSPTMFDQLSCMVFMNWQSETPLFYLSWGQTYDALRWTVGGFWTDVQSGAGNAAALNTDISGTGIQVIVAYNH